MTSPDTPEPERTTGTPDTPDTPTGAGAHEASWAVPPAAPEPVAAPDPVGQSSTPDIPPPPPPAPQTTPSAGGYGQPQGGYGQPQGGYGQGQPQGGYATPGQPTYAPPASPPPGDPNSMMNRMGGPNNILGWLALIFGIIGTGCCCCWFLDGAPFLGGIPAVVLGILHLQRVKQHRASMKWLGWVGIVLGVIALLGALCNFTTHWNDNLHDQVVDNY
ncbi:hypothetical protein HDA40_005074 [Hamadaea flava]|uniref:DUF4190 domain-containing protein n=1 Tax=Hamadaea flava TaxID=1742688 RepID=A0ABV8LGE3_9ACTN|nr:DUF4190 domain-containing protein [Hamadaea flava]MCP2326567.1 hypothetical protein [Hamadaea flava]